MLVPSSYIYCSASLDGLMCLLWLTASTTDSFPAGQTQDYWLPTKLPAVLHDGRTFVQQFALLTNGCCLPDPCPHDRLAGPLGLDEEVSNDSHHHLELLGVEKALGQAILLKQQRPARVAALND